MKYRIIRRESTSQRPAWVKKFLFALNADVYKSCSITAARNALQLIGKTIRFSECYARHKSLKLSLSTGYLSVSDDASHTTLTFSIERV